MRSSIVAAMVFSISLISPHSFAYSADSSDWPANMRDYDRAMDAAVDGEEPENLLIGVTSARAPDSQNGLESLTRARQTLQRMIASVKKIEPTGELAISHEKFVAYLSSLEKALDTPLSQGEKVKTSPALSGCLVALREYYREARSALIRMGGPQGDIDALQARVGEITRILGDK